MSMVFSCNRMLSPSIKTIGYLGKTEWSRGEVMKARHNNGMHPTADTLLVIYLQRCGAAGDAERYAAVTPKGMRRTSGPDRSNVVAPRSGFGGSWTPHNKRLNATAHSAAFIHVVWGGALSAALDARSM